MSSVFSARVKGGVIVADDVALPEGATVTVVLEDEVARDDEEPTPAQLAELDEALAEADRGDGVPWEVVRAELRGDG